MNAQDVALTLAVWTEVNKAARQGRIWYGYREQIANAAETRMLACAEGKRPSVQAAVDASIDAFPEARV